jgi:hypothetical protein
MTAATLTYATIEDVLEAAVAILCNIAAGKDVFLSRHYITRTDGTRGGGGYRVQFVSRKGVL